MKKRILLTGATGTMGMATLRELAARPDRFEITILARPGKRNRRKLAHCGALPGVDVVWGDLTSKADVERAVEGADIVLHVGGMVSPAADWHPQQTWRVNTLSMRLITDAVKARADADSVAVVYIGSVSQYGSRAVPLHWGRCGDPMIASVGDYYALSKIEAERILAESGLKRWVSLRQTGILCPELLLKGADPITFHVPLRGALEWTTAEESGRLLANLCAADLPGRFWRRFYNIGSGAAFRLSNYDFECRLMKALSCPAPEKVFETRWFATRNFHGIWYTDSDRLEEWLHFRSGTDADAYFRSMAERVPAYFRLAGIVPAALIKAGMKAVAKKKPFGTLCWERGADPGRTAAFFGSQEERGSIPGWDAFDLSPLPEKPVLLDHGYDETKPESALGIGDMRRAAEFRGGRCISETMETGDLHTPLEWECARGHRFRATPATVLLGGHWCPGCFPAAKLPAGDGSSPDAGKRDGADPGAVSRGWDYDEEARLNPFLAQAWHSTHRPDERNPFPSLPLS